MFLAAAVCYRAAEMYFPGMNRPLLCVSYSSFGGLVIQLPKPLGLSECDANLPSIHMPSSCSHPLRVVDQTSETIV